jgi:hypothetical protein
MATAAWLSGSSCEAENASGIAAEPLKFEAYFQ